MSKREEQRKNERNYSSQQSNTNRNNPRIPRSSIEPYRGNRWTQPYSFDDIFDQFKRSFDQLVEPFMPFTTPSLLGRTGVTGEFARAPLVDLIDNGDHFLVTAELPGFKKDEVNVEVNRDWLRISAEKNQETNEEQKEFVHRERAYQVFERRIVFPEDIQPQKVEATIHDGILEVKIPKKEVRPEEQPKRVQIK